jgi:hypothetical protein
MVLANLNWIGVIVATVVYFALGAAWYTLLFGKAWMRAMDKTQEELGAGPGAGYALAFALELIAVIVLAVIARSIGITGVVEGALMGAAVGIGIYAALAGTEYLFSGRNATLYMINVGYHVVALVLAGAILGVLR